MVTIRKFKGVWQVRNNNYTVEQFQRKADAERFAAMGGAFPSLASNVGDSNYVGRTAHLVR